MSNNPVHLLMLSIYTFYRFQYSSQAKQPTEYKREAPHILLLIRLD